MKTASYDDVQEILRKCFGELYLFKNVSISYQEDRKTNNFNLLVVLKESKDEDNKPPMEN